MATELDNQILKKLIDLIKSTNERIDRVERDIKNMWDYIANLYKSLCDFLGLFVKIAENRLRIIQSVIPPAFQTGDTKAKIEECERESITS